MIEIPLDSKYSTLGVRNPDHYLKKLCKRCGNPIHKMWKGCAGFCWGCLTKEEKDFILKYGARAFRKKIKDNENE